MTIILQFTLNGDSATGHLLSGPDGDIFNETEEYDTHSYLDTVMYVHNRVATNVCGTVIWAQSCDMGTNVVEPYVYI